jgi:hypothetical protein
MPYGKADDKKKPKEEESKIVKRLKAEFGSLSEAILSGSSGTYGKAADSEEANASRERTKKLKKQFDN